MDACETKSALLRRGALRPCRLTPRCARGCRPAPWSGSPRNATAASKAGFEPASSEASLFAVGFIVLIGDDTAPYQYQPLRFSIRCRIVREHKLVRVGPRSGKPARSRGAISPE